MNKVYLNYTYTDSYGITGNVRLGYLTRFVYNGVLYANCN